MSVKVKFSARSEIGKVRTNNEDNLYCNGIIMTEQDREKSFTLNGITQSPCIFAVCDGMGGEECGELASLTAVKNLNQHSQKIINNINNLNQNIYDYALDTNKKLLSQNSRMGTTLVMCVVIENYLCIYSLGDSRGYRIENNRLLRVTDDHTVAEDKARMGLITYAQSEKDRSRHILTRCLGIYEDNFTISPDVNGPYDLEKCTGALLCSDGLTEMLNFQEISWIIKNSLSPSEAVNKLVDGALERGGIDNVTCILIKIERE